MRGSTGSRVAARRMRRWFPGTIPTLTVAALVMLAGACGKSAKKVTAPAPPAAGLAVDTLWTSSTSGYAPLYVWLRGHATRGTAPYTYRWDFGDGEADTARSCSHEFDSPGTYACRLTAFDAASDSVSASVSIVASETAAPLTATPSASPSLGEAPLDVSFDCTVHNGQPPYAFAWDFGDGSEASTQQNPVHTYANPGTYRVRLQITDAASSGCVRELYVSSTSVTLRCAPKATPPAGNAPLTVAFDPGLSIPKGIFGYLWDFGDRTTGTSAAPRHVYANQGIYAVSLRVTDSRGRVARGHVSVGVGGTVVTCNATGDVAKGIAPLRVTFTGHATGGTSPYHFGWAFGDGDTALNRASVAHTYTEAGIYHAVMGVTDNASHWCADPVLVTVSRLLACSASGSPVMGLVPLAVSFTAHVEGGTSPYTYAWSFGDGATATTQPATHTYLTPGTYRAILNVTDAATASRSDTVGIVVSQSPSPAPLTCTASASPTSGTAPLDVSFQGAGVDGHPPYRFTWTFGDGAGSSDPSPTHRYSSVGIFGVTLKVQDAAGATCTKEMSVTTRTILGFTCSATADATEGYAPFSAHFSAAASGGSGSFSYHWDFGDGAGADGAAVVHDYPAAGTYDAVLTAHDGLGLTCTQHVPIVVHQSQATTLRLVNDLLNSMDAYANRVNQIVSVRIGPDAASVADWSSATEHLYPNESTSNPAGEEVIAPLRRSTVRTFARRPASMSNS